MAVGSSQQPRLTTPDIISEYLTFLPLQSVILPSIIVSF